MKQIKKWPLAIAISSALVLSACGGGGGGGSDDTGGTGGAGTAQPQSTINGTAAKGIVKGGLVKAYLVGANGKGDLIAEAETKSDGTYSLKLPSSYSGQALLLEISAKNGTLIRCDIAICVPKSDSTEAVTFGTDFSAPANFKLLAISPGVTTDTVQISATPLTSIAADLALATLQSSPSADPKQVALSSNTRVANRFNLQSDLTALKVVDLTDARAVAAADSAQAGYNLVSAAVASVPGKSMLEAFAGFAAQYSKDGVADAASSAGGPSIESILEQAVQITAQIEAQAAKQKVDLPALSSVKSNLEAGKADAALGSTTPSKGAAPADLGLEGLPATKAFVQQVRDLANLAVLEENLQGFREEVELVAQLNAPEAKASTKAVSAALRAIAQALEENQNGSDANSFEYDGLTVQRVSANYFVRQTVDTAISEEGQLRTIPVYLDLAAKVNYSDEIVEEGLEEPDYFDPHYDSAEGSWTQAGTAEADISLEGSVATDQVTINIKTGSLLKGSLVVDNSSDWKSTYYGNDYDKERYEITDLKTLLDVKMVVSGEHYVSFDGKLELDINNLKFMSEYTDGNDYDESNSELSVGHAGLVISGQLKSEQNYLEASASLNAADLAGTCIENEYYSGQLKDISDCDASDSGVISLTVSYAMHLHGMNYPIKVTANAKNNGLESIIGSASLNYEDGQRFDLVYNGKQGDLQSATLTNHNNVTLTLTEAKQDGDKTLTGNITWQGKQYATLDDKTGAVIITYNDGEFESL
ncbi:hypothetical protein HG264_09335 [Pseudomonas sp. gcc21]|uniref:hypothetical protein n=1 Tax=Pseudomonas sp. gcc21 TaxID=2726989 RepID=UPI00145222C3|nr:hypothetical protein [Pseudomonas sp. gcc21]QJD59099.1 hypothetical protein HG264_09335 [Pseudomonas sp. gcc21]